MVLAALGFGLGRLSERAESGPTGLVQGLVSVRFDEGEWTSAGAPADDIPGLELEGPVTLRSANEDRPGTIVVGLAPRAQGVGLLPRDLAAGLRGRQRRRAPRRRRALHRSAVRGAALDEGA